jgi:hypothetical protein
MNWRNATIEILPEEILLEIFDHYRVDAVAWRSTPWKWLRLAHVCRRWRQVISVSARRLDLRILCKSGTTFERMLNSWPNLPLVVQFEGCPKAKSLSANITVALRHPDRVCEIDLVLTSSITGSIAEAIQEPFQALNRIRITVEDATGTPELVHNAFLGGSAPRLNEIKLDSIAFPFPSLRQVLLSANNLVELYLSNIPHTGYFSPDDLVAGLSSLVQLISLTVGFHSPASRPPSHMTSSPQRTTLPSLISLDFHGASEYLEEFVARIDFPSLYDVTITLFYQIFFEIPKFYQFISLLNARTSPDMVLVTTSAVDVMVLLYQNGKRAAGCCALKTSCRRLDWQLYFVTQILSQLPPLPKSVDTLIISEANEMPPREEDMDSTQWLEFFQPFTHVRTVRVLERFVPGVAQALVMEDIAPGVLPELNFLSLAGHRKSPSVEKAAEQFVDTRNLSGRIVFLSD